MSTSVKHFRYTMAGAPVLNGTAGSLIAVLDACLVTGFNLKAVTSLTVADGVATATVSAHGYPADAVVLIEGATPSALNGEKRILSATTNTFTFAAQGVANGAASGTISAKLAPAGWAKPFSSGHVAVYRSHNAFGTRCFLRVDDNNPNNARVVGYVHMTDADTGTEPFPTAAQMSGGLFWLKASTSDTTARGWELFADDRTFYLHTCTSSTANIEGGSTFAFGDFVSRRSGDAFACMILGETSAVHTNSGTNTRGETVGYLRLLDALNYGSWGARSWTGLSNAVPFNRRAQSLMTNNDMYSGAAGFTFPNGPDNGLLLSRIALNESGHLRGLMRGVYVVPQNCHNAFTGGAHIDGHGELGGRRLAVVKGNGPAATSSGHMFLIDLTGPWE